MHNVRSKQKYSGRHNVKVQKYEGRVYFTITAIKIKKNLQRIRLQSNSEKSTKDS